MKSARHLWVWTVVALGCSAAGAGGVSDRMWFGGGIGVGFGDVDFVTVEPVLGYRATDRLSVGLGLIYRYSDDQRFEPDLSTSDYGASVFTRYAFTPRFFAQAEYEYLDYEFRRLDGTTDRDRFDSLRAGPGLARPLGEGRGSLYAVALYNFNHDDDGSPYDDPWSYRVGVAFGF